MAGKGSKIAAGVDEFVQAENFVRRDGFAHELRSSTKKIVHLLGSFFALERAGGEHQQSPLGRRVGGRIQKFARGLRTQRDVAGVFDPGKFGMAPDRSGGTARRVEQDEGRRRL